jgi:hypothetical protein
VAYHLLDLRVRIPPRAWKFVLCGGGKDEKENRDKETSADEEQSE